MPRAVVCGRTIAPFSFSCFVKSMTCEYRSGRRFDWTSP